MIIGFSGKKQSGKDTSGSIVQILLNSPQLNNTGVKDFLRKQVQDNDTSYYDKWVIKKFADKLKDIVCLLIGCTREQLEDETFKSTPLGEEWWYYKSGGKLFPLGQWSGIDKQIADARFLVKTTPRLLLQLVGTECGREIIHPQVWVNATLADYKGKDNTLYYYAGYDKVHQESKLKNFYKDTKENIINYLKENITFSEGTSQDWIDTHLEKWFNIHTTKVQSKWIITDMRFPNELDAIKSREGLVIRIEREYRVPCNNCQGGGCPTCSGFGYWIGERQNEHVSETALDNATFDYIIQNNGTLDDLIDSIRNILKKEGFLTKD
jgi:hypothetical protein